MKLQFIPLPLMSWLHHQRESNKMYPEEKLCKSRKLLQPFAVYSASKVLPITIWMFKIRVGHSFQKDFIPASNYHLSIISNSACIIVIKSYFRWNSIVINPLFQSDCEGLVFCWMNCHVLTPTRYNISLASYLPLSTMREYNNYEKHCKNQTICVI